MRRVVRVASLLAPVFPIPNDAAAGLRSCCQPLAVRCAAMTRNATSRSAFAATGEVDRYRYILLVGVSGVAHF